MRFYSMAALSGRGGQRPRIAYTFPRERALNTTADPKPSLITVTHAIFSVASGSARQILRRRCTGVDAASARFELDRDAIVRRAYSYIGRRSSSLSQPATIR